MLQFNDLVVGASWKRCTPQSTISGMIQTDMSFIMKMIHGTLLRGHTSPVILNLTWESEMSLEDNLCVETTCVTSGNVPLRCLNWLRKGRMLVKMIDVGVYDVYEPIPNEDELIRLAVARELPRSFKQLAELKFSNSQMKLQFGVNDLWYLIDVFDQGDPIMYPVTWFEQAQGAMQETKDLSRSGRNARRQRLEQLVCGDPKSVYRVIEALMNEDFVCVSHPASSFKNSYYHFKNDPRLPNWGLYELNEERLDLDPASSIKVGRFCVVTQMNYGHMVDLGMI